MRGSRGPPLAFLWGIQRGYSLRKENTSFGAAAVSYTHLIILFFIIGSEFFITYKVSLRKGKKEA